MSVWSLACQRSAFRRYNSEKHLSEFYPQQDGGESQLASKLLTVALCIGSCVSSHNCGVVKVDRPGQSVFEYSEDVPTANLISLGDSRGRI